MMSYHYCARLFFILILFLAGWSCKNDKSDVGPTAVIIVNRASGVTTDTFKFDAGKTIPGYANDKPYFRWDWNNDGAWDEEYSRLSEVYHRYYAPGEYSTKLEVINSSGLIDTSSVNIKVEQGYSKPRANFTVSPDFGNFKTEFTFDAGLTQDDEDSLETLQFRWDFGDTEFWDIGFKNDPVARHTYADTGWFKIRMEVRDPVKKLDYKELGLHVTDINPDIVADFTWEPEYGTTADTFKLDASISYLNNDEGGIWGYSWKLPPNYQWTEWSQDPVIYHQFPREVIYDLELKVKDGNGLANYSRKKIQIYHENLPPKPAFRIGCRKGNIKTQFYFDSWPTEDLESLPTSLQVRWDFEGDGYYDTDYSYEREAYRQYPAAGKYKVTLEAIDPDGLSDTISHYIDVSPYENETGLVWDHRDDQYYGTVKIGNQWWMSENLNFAPYDPNKDYVQRMCYSRNMFDRVNWCEVYGGLYNAYHATRNDIYGDVEGICPKGWHIPSRKDWEELIDFIGGYQQSRKLLPGGETDFNALFGGYGEMEYDPISRDYRLVMKGRNERTYFWSFTPLLGSWELVNSWNIALLNGEDKIYPGYSVNRMYLSVRCIKNDE